MSPLRIRRDAADFAEIDVVGQRQRVGRGIELDLRRRVLGGEPATPPRAVAATGCKNAFHGALLVTCSCRGVVAAVGCKNEFLHAPGFDLAEDDLVGVAAVHHVDHLEARRDFARLAELADDRAVQLRLVDLAGDVPRSRRDCRSDSSWRRRRTGAAPARCRSSSRRRDW